VSDRLLTRAQTYAALNTHTVFASIGESNLDKLVDLADAVVLRAGDQLIAEGDAAGDVFIVLSGRLEAWVRQTSGMRTIVGEIGSGEIVGEMSMVSDAPRSASVSARRDSTLLRLPREETLRLISADSAALLAMTRQLVHRLESANRSADRRSELRAIAVVPLGGFPNASSFASDLAEALAGHRVSEVVDRSRVAADVGEDAPDAPAPTADGRRVSRYLHEKEMGGAVVLLVADRTLNLWTERCIRQADRILLLGAGSAPEPSELETRLLFPPENPPAASVELVLLHADGAEPHATHTWMRGRPVARHHHVGGAGAGSVERLARRLTGAAVGLVLSGGGARGFAHIGVVRALVEAGYEFDVYGGASFGASVAAQLALGRSPERIQVEEVRATVEAGSLLDLTFPYVSLAKGKRLTLGINQSLRDHRIEDLPAEFFCVSSDLTAGRLHIHDRGPLAAAVRASVSIPGIFPPVRSADGHVLVDGGIMDNLPIAAMRERLEGGRVVAVDLKSRNELPAAELPDGGEASGWPPLLRRLNPVKARMDVPRIIDLLIRSTEVASGGRHETADVVLRPPIEGFGLLEFAAYEGIVAAGYRYACDLIEAGGLESLRSPV